MGGFRRSPAAVVANELTTLDLGLLGDVDGTITPSDGEILKWDASTKKWAPASDDERNTASNIGTFGSGLFKQKTGENLEFKNISSGSGKVSITNNTDHVNIDIVSANINTADLNNDANFVTLAGANTQLQFNNNNELGASANLTWNGSQLEVTGNVAISGTLIGTKILSSTGMDFVAGGITRLFISGSGYLGVGVTGSSTTHRLTLPNTSTGNDGKAVAHAWATYSSRRYKEDVETINDPVGIVKGLRGVNFRWKESKKKDVGFIAEEVGKVLPAIVEYEEDGINAQSMDYARLTSILVEAVKSQQRQIDEILEIIKK